MLPTSIELLYFHEVSKLGSFSSAGRKLNVSQPSMSVAIKKLEDKIGERLLIRHKDGVSLTSSGKILFEHVASLIDQWASVLQKTKNVNQHVAGEITLSCHSTLAPFITEPIANIIKRNPELKINMLHALTPEITEKLSKGQVDLGILIDPPKSNNLVLINSGDITFRFWSACNLTQETQSKTKYSIIVDRALPQTQRLLSALDQENIAYEVTTCNQLESIGLLTSHGYGIGILPDCYVEKEFANKLQAVPHLPSHTSTMYLGYHAENRNMNAIQLVKNVLVALNQA